jgi:hypothetical protein
LKQLNTATELLAYLDDFSIPFSLNEEHAQVLLDYMEGSAYGLHVDEKGQLYWVDLEGEQIEEITMDEVTFLACEWNNEFILDSRQRLEEKAGSSEEREIIDRIKQLKKDERLLDDIYEQTSLWKQVNQKATPAKKNSR